MNWPLIPIKDLCDMAVDCVNKTAPTVDHETPYKMIRTTNIKNGFIDIKEVKYVSKEVFEKWTRRSKPKFGDVILTREAPVGEVGRFTYQDCENIFLGQRLFHYRPNPLKLDWNFLAYSLQSKSVQARLKSKAFGATVPHVKVGDAESLLIPCPPLKDQKKIGSILSSYDDLISINQRRIELLEEAARRLYREWFVHLRFPGHESTRIIDGVPEGWKKLPLTKIASFTNGFAFKPSHHQHQGLPIIKIPELRYGVTNKTPRTSDREIPEKFRIKAGDIIFSWSGTLAVKEWTGENALLNQHLFIVTPKNKDTKRFILLSIENAIPSLMSQSVGSTMQHIRRSSLDDHLIRTPTTEILYKFSEIADPLMNLALSLMSMNSRLTQARDLLLPRLMSGKLDVSNIPLPEEVLA